ncbi:Mtch2 [Phodopus roborovskii]|uniref:Mtch2 protein n=1 Tax=Phodopus roborovskii TaxID=109678 RepID=A0AAU9ZZX8_PHORO|nr:Mtch2 [Phodopus roborovskii]
MAHAASQVLLGSSLTILSQPLMYVKVLIQYVSFLVSLVMLSTLQASMGGVGCSLA